MAVFVAVSNEYQKLFLLLQECVYITEAHNTDFLTLVK